VVEDAFDLAEVARDKKSGMTLEDALEVQRARWKEAGNGSRSGPLVRSAFWHSSGGSAGR